MKDNDVNKQNPSRKVAEKQYLFFVSQTERFGETSANLSERDLVTSYLMSFPALEEWELQNPEQQICVALCRI